MATFSPNKYAIAGKTYSKWAALGGLLFLLFILVQSVFRPFHSVSLSGEEWVPEVGPWSLSAIKDRSLQEQVAHRITKKFGFREVFVRSYNQLQYALFGEMTHFISEGDEQFLFENVYYNAVCGDNFVGGDALEKKVDSLVDLDQKLAESGKHLMLLLAPNKWRLLEDKVDLACKTEFSNYPVLLSKLKGSGISVLDCNSLFQNIESRHALLPKSGTHWSICGAAKVAEEIQRQWIDLGISDTLFTIDRVEDATEPRYTDRDLHDLLNIMSPPPTHNYGYPILEFKDGEKPRVLIVGDSYYLTMYYLGFHNKALHPESKLLHYHREMVKQDAETGIPFTREDLANEISEADVIIIESNEDALSKLGWGFLSDALEIVHE